jgi:hypothetical protein
LQNQIRNIERNAKDEVNKGLEHDRASDKQEIQLLKSSLDEIHKKMKVSERQTIQQDELVKQLQDKVSSTEKMVMDITLFQDQALEVLKKLEISQQILLDKVEIIQNHFQEVNRSLYNISFKEGEATAAQTTFQKVVISSAREEVLVPPRLTIVEHIIGDIILKEWETNIAESKRMAKEIKEDCEEVFYFLNKESLGIGKDDWSEILDQINIAKHQIDIKESLKEAQVEISQLKQVDIAQIDRWLVKPNL